MPQLQHDRQITYTRVNSRTDTNIKTVPGRWSDIVTAFSVPVVGQEPIDTFMKLPKARQNELKDTGATVMGKFSGSHRKASELELREATVLDLDNIPAGKADDVLRRVQTLGCASLSHGTRKYAPWQPKMRVYIPYNKPVDGEQSEAIGRMLAYMAFRDCMEWIDPTTFEPSRLMYNPSVCSDVEYVFHYNDAPFVDVDAILAMYPDWRDVDAWPKIPGHDTVSRRALEKAPDPREKKGVVGAFCKTYSVTDVLEKFIPGTYVPTDIENRYSYYASNSFGGALVYDDLFLYSHHASDPVCNQLVNAFDLVRLHKFGNLDDEVKPGTPVNKYPSYKAMCEFANSIPEVSDGLVRDRLTAAEAFDATDTTTVNDIVAVHGLLAKDSNGVPINTYRNMRVILEQDPMLRGKLAHDTFAGQGKVRGALPWNSDEKIRLWNDADDVHMRIYFEDNYGIKGKDKISDALLAMADRNRINLVEDFLHSLRWDAVKRIDTLLIDYFGADDNVYTRAVMRKVLNAACSRAVVGGTKFDNMLVLVGPQGTYKTTFVQRLAVKPEWSTSSLETFSGKDAAEVIRGVWIVEVGEMTGMKTRTVNEVKAFISRTKDDYRVPYGRQVSEFPRRCVFIGTTNNKTFLRDITGNRRFWVVDVHKERRTKSVVNDLTPHEVEQIWAEAYFYYANFGSNVVLNDEEEMIAIEEQNIHMADDDGFLGELIAWLAIPLPPDWDEKTQNERSQFWSEYAALSGSDALAADPTYVPRTSVCIQEIRVEMLNLPRGRVNWEETKKISDALQQLPGWRKSRKKIRTKLYGPQWLYQREEETEDDVL